MARTGRMTTMAALLLAASVRVGWAGSYVGTVARLEQYTDGRVYVGLNVSYKAPAACQTHPDFQVQFNLSEPAGRAMVAQLLGAQAAGLTVSLGGRGVCTLAGYEDLYFLQTD